MKQYKNRTKNFWRKKSKVYFFFPTQFTVVLTTSTTFIRTSKMYMKLDASPLCSYGNVDQTNSLQSPGLQNP